MRLEHVDVELQHFSGPLPHPEILEGYERVVPGAAKRIIDWVEDESSFRRRESSQQRDSDNRKDYLGMAMSFLLTGGIVGSGVFLLHEGKSIGGIAALVASLVPFGASIHRRRQK